MTRIILLMSLFSFVVHANKAVRDVDVRNLTDMQIYCKAFDLIYFQKYQEAIDFCEEILTHKPHNPEAHFEKGLALSYLNKWQEAVDSYDLAIKYKRQPLGEVYYHKGMAFDMRYEPLEEIENFLKKLGMSFDDIKRPLNEIEQSFKKNGALLGERERILEKIWRLEEAFKAYNLAIENGYKDRDVYYAITDIRIKLGRL